MSFPITTYNTPVAATAATMPVATTTAPLSPAVAPAVPSVPAVNTVQTPQPQLFPLPPVTPEEPTIGLKAMGGALILGAPIVAGLEYLYKDMGTGNSLIERGLAWIDTVPGIKHLGQWIDWVGNKYTAATGKPLSPRLKAWIDYANPSIDQFFQRKLPGLVLHDHANDYLNLLSHLTPTQESKDGLEALRATIASKVKSYETIASQIHLENYSSEATHSVGVAEKLLNDIKQEMDTHAAWVSDIHSPIVAPLRQTHAQNFLNRSEISSLTTASPTLQQTLTTAKTLEDVEGALFQHAKDTNTALSPAIKTAITNAKKAELEAFAAHRGVLHQGLLKQFGVTEEALKAAGFKNWEGLNKATTLRGVRKRFSQHWLALLFKDKTTRQAAQQLNKGLAQASLYQRRLAGAAERLTGMGQMFIPMYEVDRVLSTSLKNRKPVVGAVSRFIGGLMNDVRDSFNGALIGARGAASHGHWFPKLLMKAAPWLAPVVILKGPIESALKAENGDKIKTFLYDFITKEVPLMLTFIIGIKYLHEISVIKHLGTFIQFVGRNVGVSPWLKGLGNLLTNKVGFTSAYPTLARIAKPFERFNVGRLASRFFAMTGKLPGLGHITLGGFALMAILPSAIFGSRFEKRFTWLAKHSIGTPESVRKAKAQEKAAEAAALKQKLPAAFFNQRKDMGTSSPLTGQNPFGTPLVSTQGGYTPVSSMPTSGPQAGVPVTNGFKQLLATQKGPLPLANGAVPLGPNAIPDLTQAAAARGLTNDRTPATDAKKPTTPATKPTANDGVTNPLGTFKTESISPVAADLIDKDEVLKLTTEAYIKANGLEELVGSRH